MGLRRYTLVKGCNYTHVVWRSDLAHLLFPVESHILPNTHFLSPLAPSCALLLQSPAPPVDPIVPCTYSCTSMPLHPFLHSLVTPLTFALLRAHILQLKCLPFPPPLTPHCAPSCGPLYPSCTPACPHLATQMSPFSPTPYTSLCSLLWPPVPLLHPL